MVGMFTESASARLCRTFTEKVWSSWESRPDLAQRALAAFIGGGGNDSQKQTGCLKIADALRPSSHLYDVGDVGSDGSF